MPFSLYEITVPVFIHGLKTLSHLLDVGTEHEKGTNELLLIKSRLVEDQGDLVFQVQKASDAARLLAVRLSNLESAIFSNDEATIPQLHARITETINFLESVDPKSIDAAEGRSIEWNGQTLVGSDYALKFAIPNFYFHFVTAYSILRKDGVQVGKADYLGRKN